MNQRHDPNPLNGRPRRRQAYLTVLYLGLLAAGILAAWKGHQLWFAGRGGPADAAPPNYGLGDDPGGMPQWAATNPAGLVEDPLGIGGMKPLSGEPAGIRPPPGARRRWAFQSERGKETRQQARYDWRGSTDAAAAHYLKAAAGAGLAKLEDRDDASGRRVLNFAGGTTKVTVSLGKPLPGDDTVLIVLTAVTTRS